MRDVEAAVAAREEAIERVETGASEEWKGDAVETIRLLALERVAFTSEDVWEALATKPKEPRAMGAVMRRAHDAGYISPINEWRLAEDPVRHRRPLRVWQSQLKAA
jgi:hypothetical protein